MIRSLILLSLVLVLPTGCAKEDPLFCTADQMCLEGYEYCDLQGTCPASGFHGNTCIPEPCWDAGVPDVDAAVSADAGVDALTPDPAMLVVSPTSEDWGAVVAGSMSQRTTFTVTNDGGSQSGPVDISLGGTHSDQFTIENLACNGQALSPGATCDFDIRFTPSSASPADKSATLDVSASPGGQVSADLAGMALAPGDLTMNPNVEDFGIVDVGVTSASSITFTVTNTGGSPTGTLTTTPNDTTNFAIVGDTCNGTTLAASGSCSIDVDATPDSIGPHLGGLTVSATPGGNATASFSVTGRVDLIVTVAGAGDGRVTSMPASIDCTNSNSPCSSAFTQTTHVALFATPEPHALFKGWSGAGCSGLADCAVTVDSATNVTATFDRGSLDVGGGHVCAIVPGAGALRCWGHNNYGQLAASDTEIYGDNEPASASGVAIASNVVQVVTGSEHSCALLATGDVRCWGRGTYGQLGYGNTDTIGDDANETVGGIVSIGAPVRQLAAGNHHTCALLDSGAVRCWGEGNFGRLGYGDVTDRGGTMGTLPSLIGNVPLGGLATQIVAGAVHTCALLENGTVYCWGLGSSGRLGYPEYVAGAVGDSPSTTPAMVGPVNIGGTAVQIAAGGVHTCALLDTNAVRCWGDGGWGQLGTEDTEDIGNDEQPVDGPLADVGGTVLALAAGDWHTCAVMDTSEVKCWGRNDIGQLGYGHTTSIGGQNGDMPPPAVNVGGPVVEVEIDLVTCVRMATGAVRCWGDDQVGSLGYGSPEDNIGDNEHPAAAGDVPYIP